MNLLHKIAANKLKNGEDAAGSQHPHQTFQDGFNKCNDVLPIFRFFNTRQPVRLYGFLRHRSKPFAQGAA